MKYERAAKNDRWPKPVADRSGDAPTEDVRFACIECGTADARCWFNRDDPCFECSQRRRDGSSLLILIDAGGEDTPHPQRIMDGTSHRNLGLPPTYNSDGSTRPVTHAELGSNWGVREYAKRNNVEPMTRGRYRGLK
jgi:hypothetical protein